MLLFASDFCGFDLKVLPAAATLTGTRVVHLTDTAHERCSISVVVETVMVGLGRVWSYHVEHSPLFHFLDKVMGEQESLQLVFTVWEKISCSKERPEMCL